jgi:sodium transport system permease protein
MRAFAVLVKELRDSFRDHKTIASGLMFGLMGPIAVFYIIAITASLQRAEATAPVALCRLADAPALLAHLARAGIKIVEHADICLDIAEGFEARLANGEAARVGVLADLTRPSPTVATLEREIRVFSGERAAQRLIARGVAPSVITAVTVDAQNTNPVSRVASTFGAVVIIFFVLTPFIVAAGMAADVTAGERERRSLEFLLATPARASEIVLGKFLAVSVFNLAGTALCTVVGLLILDRSALPALGVRLDAGLLTTLQVIAWLAPLSLLVAAIEVTVGFWSKGFKDAQNTLMMLTLVPMGIGYASLGLSGPVGPWPVLWETGALAGPLFGSITPVAPFLVVALVELGLAAALLMLSAQRLQSPSILERA